MTISAPRRSRLAAATGATALAMSTLALAAAPASADHNGPYPSDSAELCAAADGIFADLGDGVTTCTVVDVDRETLPSNNNPRWTVLYDVTTTTVYTTEVTEEWVVTGAACINPGQGVVGGWDWQNPTEGNPNCVAAYNAGGQQPGPPHFYIEETGEWVQTIEHDKDVSVHWARVGCLNPGGNQPGDWMTNPNCFADLP